MTEIYGLTHDIWFDQETYLNGGAVTSKIRDSVHVKPEQSVTLRESQMIQGIRRDSSKKWCRWEDKQRVGFFRNARGNVVPFYKQGKSFMDATPSFEWIHHTYSLPHLILFREQVQKEFGITEVKDIYPFAGCKGISDYSRIPAQMRVFYRESNVMEFTRKAFGKRNYRKDLVRAVAEGNRLAIAVAYEFRNLVPTDWLISYINNWEGTDTYGYGKFLGLRKMLLQMDSRNFRRILRNSSTQRQVAELEDLCKRVRHLERLKQDVVIPRDRTIRSFHELHDMVMGPYALPSIAYRMENTVIEKNDLAKKIDGVVVGDGLQIVCPKDTDTMQEWSNILSNCIGSYGRQAVMGYDIYVAVYHGNELIANIEVSGTGSQATLKQFLGYKNDQDLSLSVQVPVVNFLKTLDVNCDEYWGMPSLVNQPEPYQENWNNMYLGDEPIYPQIDPVPLNDPEEFIW